MLQNGTQSSRLLGKHCRHGCKYSIREAGSEVLEIKNRKQSCHVLNSKC
jgi:hypothetical protein